VLGDGGEYFRDVHAALAVLAELEGTGISGPGWPWRTTISPFPESGWPAYLFKRGLRVEGVDMAHTPLMNSEMTLVAREGSGASWRRKG